MSRFMRGASEREDNQSNFELDLLKMFQADYLAKRILEMPLTPPWTDILLSLDRTDPIVTHPDFRWIHSAFWHPIYIDGHPHRSTKIAKRDREVNELLAEQGFTPHRYGYEGDSKAELRRVHDGIISDLKLRRKANENL